MKVGILICFIYFLLLPTIISAHSGRTDSYGGHKKNANGTYHCHSGECLKDAWNKTYNEFYPIGLEDGPTRNDQTNDIESFIWSNFDSDQAEYMAPYALEAYKMGYEETYVPTFREKYLWYIVALSALTLLLLGLAIIGIRKLKSRNNKYHFWELTREKKAILACFLFFGGWILVTFTIGDYFQWHNHLGIFMLVWLFTFLLLIRFIYREGVKQMKEEEEEKKRRKTIIAFNENIEFTRNRDENK